MAPIKTACRYFDDKHKGKIIGIILTGFGMSSSVIIYIAEYIINPNAEKPNDDGFYSKEIASRVDIIIFNISV